MTVGQFPRCPLCLCSVAAIVGDIGFDHAVTTDTEQSTEIDL